MPFELSSSLTICSHSASRSAVNLNLMGSLEVSTAIIIASIPAMMPLFRLAAQRGRSLVRAPPSPPTHNVQRTPPRSSSFARHLEGLQSGESILLDDLLAGRTPTRARTADISAEDNTSPAPLPRTPVSQRTGTIQGPLSSMVHSPLAVLNSPLNSPSASFTPTTPMTSFVSDTPPRLEIRVETASFISESLAELDAGRTGDVGSQGRKFGTTTTITAGEAAN